MNTNKGLTVWRNRWSPVAQLSREMDRLLEDFWLTRGETEERSQFHVPACDVQESENHYLLSVEMPGVAKDDIKIEVVNNELIISGERREEKSKKEEATWYSERRFGKFQRSFSLSAGVDANKVEAQYQDGILKVAVPKVEAAKPRQIKITQGSTPGFFGKLLNKEVRKDETKEPPKEKSAA